MSATAGLGPTALAGGAPADAGGIGIQLLQAPESRRGDIRALHYIVDHLAPGTTIQRQIRVVNHTSTNQTIDLYPAAAAISEGRFQFADARTANELTSWISLTSAELQLAPGADARVTVAIEVPKAASAGERYGVIWAATRPDPQGSGNIAQISRVGIRVYLDIGAGGEPAAAFSLGDFRPARDAQGHPSLAVQATNTGQRAVDLTGSLMLTDGPAGSRAGPFELTQTVTLAPGQAGSLVVQLPAELPIGPWLAEITARSGPVSHSASARVMFPAAGRVGSVISVSHRKPLLPTAGAGGALALAAAALLLVVVRRRRRREHAGSISS